MTGKHGLISPANTNIRSLVTISPSQTQFVSKKLSRRKLVMLCFLRSIKSDRSLNLFKLLQMLTLRDGVSWSLIVPVRQRILLSLILLLDSVLVKSRLEPPAAGSSLSLTKKLTNSERLAKYNQLLRIEAELGDKAIYAGNYFRSAVKM